MYYYENHLGGYYKDERDLDYEDLYCEECGDSDTCLGWFDSDFDFVKSEINYYTDDECINYWAEDFNLTEEEVKELVEYRDNLCKDAKEEALAWLDEHNMTLEDFFNTEYMHRTSTDKKIKKKPFVEYLADKYNLKLDEAFYSAYEIIFNCFEEYKL